MFFLLLLPLVLSDVGTLAEHLCLEGDFDSQVQSFINNVMFSTEDEGQIRRLLNDVKTTMQQRWPGTEVLPFGSVVTGVALKSSDADCYVKIPNFNSSADNYVLEEATKLLLQQPEVFSHLTSHLVKMTGISTILTFHHNPTARNCDVTFTNNAIYLESNLIGYYLSLNKNIKPLVGIVKFWFQVHQIKKETKMISFDLYLLIIFYLQQINMVPPAFTLQRKDRHLNGIWDMSFNEIPHSSTNTDSLYQLLGGFFTYYSEFDFKDYIVSPYAGLPIRKSDFLTIDRVPDMFYFYKVNMKDADLSPLQVNSSLVIQDMFEHQLSTAPQVTHEQAALFVSHLKLAARMFKEVPRDVFLKALFTKPEDKGELTESERNG